MKKLPLKGLIPNSSYSVSVRGKDASGNYTPWSNFLTFITLADILAPSTPVAPTVSLSGPQNIIVEHTLNTTTSGKLETDVVYLEVQTSDSTDSYTATINIGNIPVGPLSSAGVSQRFVYPAPSYDNNVFVKARVRAIDRSGNQSAWSSWSSPSSTIPYFDAAYIGSLTVDSLSAEKITSGTLGLVNTAADTKLSIGDNSTYIMLRNNHLTGSTSPKGQMYIATTGTPANPTGATGSGYRDVNTKFYVDSSGKFSLGTNLYWDGSTLNIIGTLDADGIMTGTINATGGDFTSYVTAGSTSIGKGWLIGSSPYDGIKISTNNYWGVSGSGDSNARFKVGDANNFVQWSGNQLDVQGNIVATGGSFLSYLTAGNVYIGKDITISGQTGVWDGVRLNQYNFWADQSGSVKFQVGSLTKYLKWTGSALEVSGDITSGSTITGAILKTALTGTRIEIDSTSAAGSIAYIVNELTNPGYIAGFNIVGEGGLQIKAPNNSNTYAPIINLDGYNGSFKFIIGSDTRLVITPTTTIIYGQTTINNGSNQPVTISDQTPTGISGRSARNIFITSGATPSGFTGGDVWLVYT